MKKNLLVILLLITISFTFAQSDTTSLKIADAVITANRLTHKLFTVTEIKRETIENSMQSSVLPILNENVPGLFSTSRGMMGYGVSTGAAGAISIRGISGSSGRMMVLIDGHPQYQGIFGHPIADSYQSYMIENLSVARGPASVAYGSNAMGGVINISTRKALEDGVKTRIHTGYGSFNTLETNGVVLGKKGKFTAEVGASLGRTDGHRENTAFDEIGGFAKFGYEFTRNWKANINFNATHFSAEYPGLETAPIYDARQHITRYESSLSIDNQYEKTYGTIMIFCNWGDHDIYDGYSEGQTPLEYNFRSHDIMTGFSISQNVLIGNSTKLTAGMDMFHNGGKARNVYYTGEESLIADKAADELAGYVQLRQYIRDFMSIDAGIRVDRNFTIGTEAVPEAGISFVLPRSIDLRLSASKGFRNPTIREMYMYPPQNPDLKPESMWNYEIAFSQNLGKVSYGVNLFYIDAKNIIQTLPNPTGAGKLNQNSGRLQNFGAELQVNWSISSAWSINSNYSYLHMVTPVIAAPEHKLYAGGTFHKGKWYASTGMQLICGLYTTTDSKTSFLLWNMRGAFRPLKWLEIWARGENLLDTKYEINAGFPMPGINFMAGLNFMF